MGRSNIAMRERLPIMHARTGSHGTASTFGPHMNLHLLQNHVRTGTC